MSDIRKAATPRPWNYTVPIALDYRSALIYDEGKKSLIAQMCGGGRLRAIDVVEERANAALIVRAVNAHDVLVEALRGLLPSVAWALGELVDPPTPTMAEGKAAINAARAALALAEGKP